MFRPANVAESINQIEQLEPLRKLKNLVEINLSKNRIKELEPLVENPHIGSGVVVKLRDNAFDCSDEETLKKIQKLLQRGVNSEIKCLTNRDSKNETGL